jgi:adenosylhomocysteine nucleosidase
VESVLLFVAAESFEFGWLRRTAEELTEQRWNVRFARTGKLNGRRFAAVANGPGPRLAAHALQEAGRRVNVEAVVSTGLCGGLDPAMQVGDIFIASRVNGIPAGQPVARGKHFQGDLVSQDRVIGTKPEKARLRDSGASAVEMEADAVARWALENRLPFYCVRAVSDGAGREFALDLNKMRDADGRFSTTRIVAAALLRPWKLVPELLQLKRESDTAIRTLGEFIADCRFQ